MVRSPSRATIALCLLAGMPGLATAAPAGVHAPAGASAAQEVAAPVNPDAPAPPAALSTAPVPPDLAAALAGSDMDGATDAADKIAALRSKASLDALLQALAMGPPPRLAYEILQQIQPYRSPSEISVVGAYLHDRNADLREKAVAAIGVIEDSRVGQLVVHALSDQSESVRGTAATLLASRKEPGAEAHLLTLFERGDGAVAVPLGMVATVSSASQLGELYGKVPNDLLVSCLGTMLTRADFGPDDLRVQVVKLLGKIPGAEATAALDQYVASVPETPPRASRTEAQKALEGRK